MVDAQREQRCQRSGTGVGWIYQMTGDIDCNVFCPGCGQVTRMIRRSDDDFDWIYSEHNKTEKRAQP